VSTSDVDVVLFDLGGVLIDFGGVEPMRELAGIDSDEELWQRWLNCPWVRTFERGHCSPEEFGTGMVEEWALAVSPEEYLTAFASWPGGPLPGAFELAQEVRQLLPTGCLSNTNALHWTAHFSQWRLLDALDHYFLSFEMGMVKPDAEIFGAVATSLGTHPSRIVFLDDNMLNVEAAAQAGFRSGHVRGVEGARIHLIELGILPADGSSG
jgi:putative hydrolase of the HAD superfamily